MLKIITSVVLSLVTIMAVTLFAVTVPAQSQKIDENAAAITSNETYIKTVDDALENLQEAFDDIDNIVTGLKLYTYDNYIDFSNSIFSNIEFEETYDYVLYFDIPIQKILSFDFISSSDLGIYELLLYNDTNELEYLNITIDTFYAATFVYIKDNDPHVEMYYQNLSGLHSANTEVGQYNKIALLADDADNIIRCFYKL